MYNIMIHVFKHCTHLRVITKYWLCSQAVQNTYVMYLIVCTSLSPYPSLPPPLPLPTGNHLFVLYVIETASLLLHSLVVFFTYFF